ncbi:SDR family oxidoreductase [Parahaliea sp. F7430]|uniref:SDR family oxidoreductase n=1 Tax=Sediminihaliea albiluteola TaxID=2758564 RepID=A0A7W2TXD2_9GAMM|nr:SDR family oxidoreductase [Sediminihaliea albiluteola]MBA6413694.1 SDR family oxidoreductase [Sediminihaliea albiluteola]
MKSNLEGLHYLITGGSSGFGLAIARALVAKGAHVILLGRSKGPLDAAVEELGADHATARVCDVSNASEVNKVFASLPALDGLINNAGMARPGAVENLIAEEVQMQVNTNFLGTVYCCQAAIPLLRKNRANPRIVNISSASAWHHDEMAHLSIYASTKAAVERFTRDLREEVQADGIGVTCLRPGSAWTNFSDGWNEEAVRSGFEAWMKYGPEMDTGMEPEHVAESVAHVLSYPPGVAVDLLEVRPNQPILKPTYEDRQPS